MERETKYYLLLAIFVATMTFINLTGAKIVPFFGLTISVSAFFYAFTFPITDAVSECWGRGRAQKMVWMGFIAIIFAAVFTQIAVAIPPADFWTEQQKAYAETFQLVGRLALGGVFAYIVSQSFDVWAFHWIRRRTNNRWLWVRNNASTVVSQFLDTIIFITVGFIGTMSASTFVSLIVGQYLVKAGIAVLDTPFVYLLRKWIGVSPEIIARHKTGT